jgi:hypothetical protein
MLMVVGDRVQSDRQSEDAGIAKEETKTLQRTGTAWESGFTARAVKMIFMMK